MEDYLKEELDKRNIFNFHGNTRNLKGFPDRVVMASKIWFIELKLGKENKSYYTQTKTQKKWEKQIEQTKNIYLLLSNREQIDFWVKEIYEECLLDDIKNHFAYDKNVKRDE